MADDNIVFPIGEDDSYLAAQFFEPSALTLAREFRGLTKAELANFINKTPGAVSQFESGFSKPDAMTLKTISFTLGFPVNFFAKKMANQLITIESCHFRSLRSATQKERRKILANGTILKNLVDIFDSYVNIPPENVPKATSTIIDDDEIERLAVEVRKYWGLGIGPISNIVNLLELNGIVVSFIPEDSKGIDSFSVWQEYRPYIFLVPTKMSTSHTRFDCAHELGHLVMHIDVSPGDKIKEAQANRFAGAFLVPRDAFILESPRRLNWEHFYELKRRWRVSVAALVRRAYDLECISEAAYRRAYVHLNQSGERQQEKFEPPLELPSLINQSLKIVESKLSFDDISKHLRMRPEELTRFISASNGTKLQNLNQP